MARYSNFTIVQGEEVILTYTIKDSTGNPFNLTGYTVNGSLIRSYTDPNDLPISFAVNVNADPTTGKMTLSLGSNQTLLLALDNYNFEVMITNGSNTYQVLIGVVQVLPGINTRGKYTYIPADEINPQTKPMNFIFNTPQTVWTINHNLNTLNVAIIAYDTNGNQIQGTVQLVSVDTATVSFAVAQAGTAVVFVSQ